MCKITTRLSIYRSGGGDSGERIVIELKDSLSGMRISKTEMSVEEYGLILSGLSEVVCETKFYK